MRRSKPTLRLDHHPIINPKPNRRKAPRKVAGSARNGWRHDLGMTWRHHRNPQPRHHLRDERRELPPTRSHRTQTWTGSSAHPRDNQSLILIVAQNSHHPLCECRAASIITAPRLAGLILIVALLSSRLSRHTLVLFLTDGRVCLTNNAAERWLRGIAIGPKSWRFCGSDRGGERAARMYSLFVTCKLNDVDGLAWLTDVLGRIADHPAHRLDELLPWKWKALRKQVDVAVAA
jgi:hypothetical protein